MSVRAVRLVCAGMLGLLAAVLWAGDSSAKDLRSIIVLREDCTSSLSRQELTLFANGTLRLRQGPTDAVKMTLRELGRAERDRYLARLEALDLSEAEASSRGPAGEWTEHCVLELARPNHAAERFEYEHLSTGSLALERARRLIEDLYDEIKGAIGASEIPATYKPMIGDRLERNDGELFEVVSFTLDGKGVELEGVVQPITLFVERDKLKELFRRIAPRS